MLIPANPAAEQVARLRSVNEDITSQIDALEKSKLSNAQIIEAFDPISEWTELPDPEPEVLPAAEVWTDVPVPAEAPAPAEPAV